MASIRRQVPAFVMMPERGWRTSCAIDAVSAPRVVIRATWASSDRTVPSASSDRTDVFRPTGFVQYPAAHDVDVFHGTGWHHEPTFEVEVSSVGHLRTCLVHERHI